MMSKLGIKETIILFKKFVITLLIVQMIWKKDAILSR